MTRAKLPVGLLALLFLVTGCASAHQATQAGSAQSPATSQSMPGMSTGQTSMTPGETMAGMTAAPASGAAGAPSATAKMVCGDDIRAQVTQVLQLKMPAITHSTWTNQLFSCTYALPMGPMVLSVEQSSTNAEAAKYFAALRPSLGKTETVPGLGERAYGTGTGIILVIKDNMTLKVDTTALPEVFGSNQQRRSDLAYEVASDVLGCWTGDE